MPPYGFRLVAEKIRQQCQRQLRRSTAHIIEERVSSSRRADNEASELESQGPMIYYSTMKHCAAFLVLGLLQEALCGQIPPAIIPAGVGVNIHFVTGHARDLDLITNAGFRFVRMDFSWEATEGKAGVYDWTEYDELTAHLEQRGLWALYILDYVNGLYEPMVDARRAVGEPAPERHVASPRHPESVAAFACWAAAAAVHFRGRHVLWEIYNEPNGDFWRPKPDAAEYTTLALATAKAIREAEPSATIIAPAMSGFDWKYMESFLQSGVLEFLDGVSVHPYRPPDRPPETAARITKGCASCPTVPEKDVRFSCTQSTRGGVTKTVTSPVFSERPPISGPLRQFGAPAELST